MFHVPTTQHLQQCIQEWNYKLNTSNHYKNTNNSSSKPQSP